MKIISQRKEKERKDTHFLYRHETVEIARRALQQRKNKMNEK